MDKLSSARLAALLSILTCFSSVSATYSLDPSPCSLAAAVSAPFAVSPALAPDDGSPSSFDAPAAPADALTPGALVVAARGNIRIR